MRESTAPPLARAAVDRDGDTRSLSDFAERFDADPASRVLIVHRGRALLAERVEGSPPMLDLRHPSELPSPGLRVYLGRLGELGVPVSREGAFASTTGIPVELRVFDADAAASIEQETARWAGLRTAAPMFDDGQAALLAEALAMANWHDGNGFCPRCGASTSIEQAGWVRRCDREGNLLFPRTDSAVIVLVTDDDDRVLLGSNALWEPNRFSLLAGFVEPGESLESAVVREIGEEAGIRVGRVAYAGSQPWPLPASLMLGFTARVESDAAAARPDGVEIIELRWFTRAELAQAGSDIGLPGETSIARWMLERWFGGPIR